MKNSSVTKGLQRGFLTFWTSKIHSLRLLFSKKSNFVQIILFCENCLDKLRPSRMPYVLFEGGHLANFRSETLWETNIWKLELILCKNEKHLGYKRSTGHFLDVLDFENSSSPTVVFKKIEFCSAHFVLWKLFRQTSP